MTLVVPFDGSALAEAALTRATELRPAFHETIVAVSVIPEGDTDYASDRGWIRPDEEFDSEEVVSLLRDQVTALCPSVAFRHTVKNLPFHSTTLASCIHDLALDEDASVLIIGSENSGQVVTALHRLQEGLAPEEIYDMILVRSP